MLHMNTRRIWVNREQALQWALSLVAKKIKNKKTEKERENKRKLKLVFFNPQNNVIYQAPSLVSIHLSLVSIYSEELKIHNARISHVFTLYISVPRKVLLLCEPN